MTAPLHFEPDAAPALRVVLVEDSAMLRGMLCEMLAELDRVSVVAEAEDEQGALAALETQRPDLAIIDLELRSQLAGRWRMAAGRYIQRLRRKSISMPTTTATIRLST